MNLKGTIARHGFAGGGWILKSARGKTYELANLPTNLKKEGLLVELTGTVQESAVSISMTGPIFLVQNGSPIQ